MLFGDFLHRVGVESEVDVFLNAIGSAVEGREVLKSSGRDEDEARGLLAIVGGGRGVLDQAGEFGFEGFEILRAAERFAIAEKPDDQIGLEGGEPFVGGFVESVADVARAPAVSGIGEGSEFLGTGKGPGAFACGVGSEAGGVSFIAHVTNEELVFWVTGVEFAFEMVEVGHARSEASADEDDAGVGWEVEGLGEDREGEEKSDEDFHGEKQGEPFGREPITLDSSLEIKMDSPPLLEQRAVRSSR